ncbi:MAG: chromate efflux transporter [Verrucomicrobiae bacterium]|nr:chromate efflux transporter [Verrucomicrobiae bacterium]
MDSTPETRSSTTVEGLPQTPHPTLREASGFWLRLGIVSFGGPSAQIALMHRELVETKKWVGDGHFFRALNYCMLLPGPEAQQLATYLGWRMHGIRGGLVAGIFFILPSAMLLWAISLLYSLYGEVPLVAALFHGMKAAVMALLAEAIIRIGRKTLRAPWQWVLCLVSFVGIGFWKVPFPVILAVAALTGLIAAKCTPGKTSAPPSAPPQAGSAGPGSFHRLPLLTALFGILWAAPFLLIHLLMPETPADFLKTMGMFFSKTSLMTFGGAYAILPYVSQVAVETRHWLTPVQMMDGLALAETTPGPLIMVLQFVGFVGSWNRFPGDLLTATLAAGLTTWVTFLPSFYFIFAGAPLVEKSAGFPTLNIVLSGVTAAIVGVILNLGVWFSIHALWPGDGGPDVFVLLLALPAFAALKFTRVGPLTTVALCGLAGVAWHGWA